jgi:uncharacterized membrane protein YdjX (TVP38/TMEM64 family)
MQDKNNDMPSYLLPMVKLALVFVAVMAVIIAPFLVWGATIERLAPALLTTASTKLLIAAIGAALLTADVALPIPSSIISVMVCLLTDPLLGAAAILVGMLGSFLCGYYLGRLVPQDALRRWVGPELWDSVSRQAARSGVIWIMASRPVPVLAEATSIISGSLGVPFKPAMLAALLSSAGVAGCYGAAAVVGLSNGGFWLAFAMSIALAALLWLLSRTWRDRMGV